MKELNVAIIGCGFVGKVHSYGFKNVNFFFDINIIPKMTLAIDSDRNMEKNAKKYGWINFSTDWKDALNDEVDIVDVATPVFLHKEMVIEAAKRGKIVICEKPLTLSLKDAEEIIKAVEESKIKHLINYSFRKIPAIAYAKELIQSGKLGEIYHWRARWLSDVIIDKNLAIDWRMKNSMAGGGASADINSHLIDLAIFLNDEIFEVSSVKKTFINERPAGSTKTEIVDVDDAINCIVKFKNGSLGVFESSRVCSGRKESVAIEINGTNGAIIYDYQNFNELKVFLKDKDKKNNGFKILKIYNKEYPYMGKWWPEGHGINYENIIINQFNDFFLSLENNTMPSPNLYDGLKVQRVMEAMSRSDLEKKWIKIEDL